MGVFHPDKVTLVVRRNGERVAANVEQEILDAIYAAYLADPAASARLAERVLPSGPFWLYDGIQLLLYRTEPYTATPDPKIYYFTPTKGWEAYP